MDKFKKKALLNGLGILAVIAGTTILVLTNILNAWAFILAAIACFPMAKVLWKYVTRVCLNPIRILRKVLPKIGFSIDTAVWGDEDHTYIDFSGQYREDTFLIRASNDTLYITIYDLPWIHVKSSDPNMLRYFEAINEVNAGHTNSNIVIGQPDSEGNRQIYTKSLTIIPSYSPEDYLGNLLCNMLNLKNAFREAYNKERPYMNQRRGPVGFSVPQPEASIEEPLAPAAKTTAPVKE